MYMTPEQHQDCGELIKNAYRILWDCQDMFFAYYGATGFDRAKKATFDLWLVKDDLESECGHYCDIVVAKKLYQIDYNATDIDLVAVISLLMATKDIIEKNVGKYATEKINKSIRSAKALRLFQISRPKRLKIEVAENFLAKRVSEIFSNAGVNSEFVNAKCRCFRINGNNYYIASKYDDLFTITSGQPCPKCRMWNIKVPSSPAERTFNYWRMNSDLKDFAFEVQKEAKDEGY